MAATYALSVPRNDEQILSYCTKQLARGVKLFRDNIIPESFNLANISENWRSPLVEPALDVSGTTGVMNLVTLVWMATVGQPVNDVKAIGSFIPWYEKIDLTPLQFDGKDTSFYACQLMLPVRKSYRYRYVINGNEIIDPINPPIKYSRMARHGHSFALIFSILLKNLKNGKLNLLYRLANQVVPFQIKRG